MYTSPTCKPVVMKILLKIVALFLVVGVTSPISSYLLFNGSHDILLTPIAILSALLGSGILFGFSGYRSNPRSIGNFDNEPIRINQTWMVFFIALSCNLLAANLCG